MSNLWADLAISVAVAAIGSASAWLVLRQHKLPMSPSLSVGTFVILLGVTLYHPSSPFFYLFPDADSYLGLAEEIAAQWAGAAPNKILPPWPNKLFFPTILASFIWLAGPVHIAPIVFNGLVMTNVVAMLQWGTYELTGVKDRYVMQLIFLTGGPFLIFGPAPLREAIFWLAGTLGLLAVLMATKKRTRLALAFGLGSVLIFLAIRPNFGMAMSYAVVASLILALGVIPRPRVFWKTIGALLAIAALIISSPFALGLVREDLDAEEVEIVTESLSREDRTVSSFGNNSDSPTVSQPELCNSSGITKLACNSVENSGRVLFGPYFWELGPELVWVVSLASTLHFQLLALLSLVFFIKFPNKRAQSILIGGLVFCSLAIVSSVLTNYGIVIRFRAISEIFLVPTAIGGWYSLEGYLFQRKREEES